MGISTNQQRIYFLRVYKIGNVFDEEWIQPFYNVWTISTVISIASLLYNYIYI